MEGAECVASIVVVEMAVKTGAEAAVLQVDLLEDVGGSVTPLHLQSLG